MSETEDRGPSYWNYRVRSYTAFTGVPGVDPEECCDIIEVYYDENDKITNWGNTTGPFGNSVEDLRYELNRYLEALDKPVLTKEELP